MKTRAAALIVLLVILVPAHSGAQLQRNRDTAVPAELMKATATELSGARAFNNIVEIAGYEYDRKPEEYAGTYRESLAVERLAKEYGFANVRITRLPVPYRQWDAEDAELWVTSPQKILVSRYLDNPAMLVYGSRSADVTAPLVWVGRGLRDSDYTGREVRGKIVLTDGPAAGVHELAVRKHGAAGVVTFVNEYGFGLDEPDQLAQVRLPNAFDESLDAGTTFAIMLSQRQGQKLFELVNTNDRVTVQVKVRATRHAADDEVVEGWIPGDGSSTQEVVIVAHLFEFIVKQGANDDISGCGAALELGRTWVKLIKDGVLPKPKRAVHFLWVPEIVYANEYWKKYPDFPKNTLAMTSMDIVGSNQTINRNEMRVLLNPYSFPSFLDDLYIQFMEWMEDTQAIKYHNLTNEGFSGRYMQDPIVDPQGTQDPFHIRIMKHAGGSDHLPFLRSNPRAAGVHYMNWPDVHYHTSEDLTKFLDPTQLKRASLITLWVSMAMANASPEDALMIGGLTAGHAVERIGRDLTLAMEMLRAAKPGELDGAYKEGLVIVRQAYRREARAIQSSAKMMGTDAKALAGLKEIEKSVMATEAQDVTRLQAVYKAVATQRGQPVTLTPSMTAEESAAASLFPRPKGGDPYVGTGGPGQLSGPATQPTMHPGERQFALYDEEARNFADGTRSILEIREAISAELGPIAVGKVVKFFRDLEQIGTWEIAQRASSTASAR
jgi:aminopeptidase YwaD